MQGKTGAFETRSHEKNPRPILADRSRGSCCPAQTFPWARIVRRPRVGFVLRTRTGACGIFRRIFIHGVDGQIRYQAGDAAAGTICCEWCAGSGALDLYGGAGATWVEAGISEGERRDFGDRPWGAAYGELALPSDEVRPSIVPVGSAAHTSMPVYRLAAKSTH
jgi:hypothetical protein